MNIRTEYERSISELSDSLRAQAAEIERDFVREEEPESPESPERRAPITQLTPMTSVDHLMINKNSTFSKIQHNIDA